MNGKQARALDKHQLLDFVNDLRCTQCDHCVNGEWSSYDGKMYCQSCWDFNREEEERLKQKEIRELKNRLSELGVDVSGLHGNTIKLDE